MRVDGGNPLAGLVLQSGEVNQLLMNLGLGESLRARILEITSGEALLQLMDGRVFRADIESSTQAEPGKVFQFAVSDRQDGRLTLRIKPETPQSVQTSGQVSPMVIKALEHLGLPPDPFNLTLMNELLSRGAEPTQALFSAARQASKTLQMVPEFAGFLAAAKLPVEEKNIQILQNMMINRMQSGSQLKNLQDAVMRLTPEAADSLLKVLTEQKPIGSSWPTGSKEPVQFQSAPEQVTKTPTAKDPGRLMQTEKAADELKQQIPAVKRTDRAESAVNPLAEGKVETASKAPTESVTVRIVSEQSEVPVQKTDLRRVAIDGDEKAAAQPADKGTESAVKIKIKNILDQHFTDPKRWIATEGPEKKPSHQLREMGETLAKIEAWATANAEIAGQTGQVAGQIQNDLQFLQRINQFATYLQLPVKLQDNRGNAEIYVMKRQKSRKIDPNDVSVLVSLDTENLGVVDTLLSKSRDSITVNIRVNDEEMAALARSQYKLLYESLQEKGFRLVDFKVRGSAERDLPVHAEQKLGRIRQTHRSGMDIRL